MTNLVTPKAADGHAPTIKGTAAMPDTADKELLANNSTARELDTLDTFLDVNLGTQEYRDYQRKVSYYKLWIKLAITVFLQSCLCFAFLAFFVYVRPSENARGEGGKRIAGDRWPNILGITVVLTVIGTATTFLLVFSLSWTFQRWRSARGLMANTFVTLRDLYIYVATGLPDGEANTLRTSLLWFAAVLVIYMDVQSAKEDRIHFLPERLRLNLHLAKKLAMAFTESVDKHAWKDDHPDKEALKRAKLAKVEGTRFKAKVKGDETQSDSCRKRENKKSKVAFLKNEVLKAHVQVRKELVRLDEKEVVVLDEKGDVVLDEKGDEKKARVLSKAVNIPVVANKMHSTLLQNFYDMDKFKNVEMPRLIKTLLFLLTSVYTWIIFPVLMPYVFVMSLDQHAIKTHLLLTNRWPTAVFVPIFIVSTSIVLFYFNLLYQIQAELEDPFGDDYSDIKLRKLFLTPLMKDFQDISLALKASEGQDGDEASNIFVKLVKDMSVMKFDDRASFRAPRVIARSVDGDGEEGDPK